MPTPRDEKPEVWRDWPAQETVTRQCRLCGDAVSGPAGEIDVLCAIHYAAEHCG